MRFANINIEKLDAYIPKGEAWSQDNQRHIEEVLIQTGMATRDYYRIKTNNCTIYYPLKDTDDLNTCKDIVQRVLDENQKIALYYKDDRIAIAGYNDIRFVLPVETVTEEELPNYDDMTSEQLLELSSGQSTLPSVPGKSKVAVNKELESASMALREMERYQESVKAGTAAELADLNEQINALKAEMERKKQEIIAGMQGKMQAMQEKVAELKRQIFILDTQLYGLRCYLGETIQFHTIRDGEPAAKDLPVIIYQKIRYLDEEMGRYLSLYELGDQRNHTETLIEAMRHRDDIADILAPGPKSINVAKLSRTGTVVAGSEQCQNMLAHYKMLHKNQLALFIRNGEQLYVTWLDADKIQVSDGNMFLSPKVVEDTGKVPKDSWEKERLEKERNRQRNEILSRWFFFNILQGILDNTTMLDIPEKVNIATGRSQYVVFSSADGWIETNLYGTFEDMLDRSKDIFLKKGDMILTGTQITRGDRHWDKAWSNTRGIGEKNRTSGVSLPSRKFLPVNKILTGALVRYTADIYEAEIVYEPEGRTVYKSKDGSSECSYRRSETDTVMYRPAYKLRKKDTFVRREYWESKVSADTIRTYNADLYNYKKKYASLKDYLIARSPDESQGFFYTEKGMDGRVKTVNVSENQWDDSDLIKSYENNLPVYYREITDAEIVKDINPEYYVSVKQEGYSAGSRYNPSHETEWFVNFMVEDDEFIPMPFLCSTWIEEIIRSGKIGYYRLCGAEMTYASFLPYLNQIKDHLKEREVLEKKLLDDIQVGWTDAHPDWDAILCDWRIRNKVNTLTKRSAKKFLKEVKK